MSIVKPFKAVVPVKDLAYKVSCSSVDFLTKEEFFNEINTNKESYYQIIKPSLEAEAKNKKPNFKKIRQNYEEFLLNQIYEKKQKEGFYIYQQKEGEEVFTGILALISTEEYKNGTIKKHELTLEKREQLFSEFLQQTQFNAEPILLTYPKNRPLSTIFQKTMQEQKPILDFKDSSKNEHKVWMVTNSETIQFIENQFQETPHLYIADGHHRIASSARCGMALGNKNSKYALAYLVADDSLKIYDYNRMISDLNKHTTASFLSELSTVCHIEAIEKATFPSERHQLIMFLDNTYYKLSFKEELSSDKGVSGLDAHLLDKHILNPILGIEDSRNNKRLAYVKGKGGLKSIKDLEHQMKKNDFKVGFCLYPVSSISLFEIADLAQIMPPKSTFIKPRLQSGMLLYDFKS